MKSKITMNDEELEELTKAWEGFPRATKVYLPDDCYIVEDEHDESGLFEED